MVRGLAALLNEEKRRRGWSNSELARRAGVTSQGIGKIIDNPDRLPDLETLAGLAQALGMPLGRLVEACGFPLGAYTGDEAQQLAAIAAAVPSVKGIVDRFLKLHPEDQAAVLAYIQGILSQYHPE